MGVMRAMPRKIVAYYKARLITSVEIPDRDPMFGWLDNWLAAHPESHGKRAYIVKTEAIPERMPAACPPGSISSSHASLRFRDRVVLSPAPGSGLVRYGNHRLWVDRQRRYYETAFNGVPYTDTFKITCLGPLANITALLDEARDASQSDEDRGVPVLVGAHGAWGHQGYKPRRPLESVMLDRGSLDDILGDLRQFYASGDWYRDRGIPWQRGYLFAGIPGSGKTSTSLAIAGKLGLSIAIVSLSSSDMNDQAVANLMLSLPKNSLLLVEDVDALFVDRESKCSVTFAGFLNALDGVAAAEGRVLVMTTNHPEKLDPALVRAGRVDRRVDFTFATADQARRLFLWFFRDAELTAGELASLADAFATSITATDVSMAAIQEHLVQHRDSPARAAFSVSGLAIAA
jgi:chaperone BCS1